ncbi:MAG: hypothetical protein GY774_37415 [Planctomycetes bacterium]|nr:hypothetical protein [Planctomycetota bacterium]
MMKKNILTTIIMLGFSLSPVLISGCTANRVDLVDTGVLSLEQHTTGKIYIIWSDAYEDGDGFVVTGVFRRRDTVGLPIKVHVDVTILSLSGKVLDEGRSSDIYIPRHIVCRGKSFKRFKVRFPNIPAEGSKASIVVHSG